MRQFLVAVQKNLNIRSFGHFYGLCCQEEEYSLSFNLRLCKWMKLTKTLCELVCGSGGVKSPPHHLLCFQDAGYAAHLSHRVSHSSLVTNASSARSFPVSIVFCHFFPLACPLTWFLYSFLCSPPSPALSSLPPVSSSLSPLQCVVLSLPPPSCLAICQPFPVSSLKWPAGSSHSLMNTNTEQHKKHISFSLASNLLFLACPYNTVRAHCKRFTK